jgi:hypothetical protein
VASSLQISPTEPGGLSDADIREFHARYAPLPIVTLSKAVADYPAVVVDNKPGMRELLSHLIEVHGYRRIAFVRGPTQHPYAEERYHIYLEVLREYGISKNDDLITPPGNFRRPAEAILELFFEQRGLRPSQDIQAIVAVSDILAIDLLSLLQKRGIRIPEDMAVAGFNNSFEAQSVIPPLTSVDVLFHEQARLAVTTLCRLLNCETVPSNITLPTRVAVHQSCGCFDSTVSQAGDLPATPHATTAQSIQRDVIIRKMLESMNQSAFCERDLRVEQLFDEFIAALETGNAAKFLHPFREVLTQAIRASEDPLVWQNILSLLQSHFISQSSQGHTLCFDCTH